MTAETTPEETTPTPRKRAAKKTTPPKVVAPPPPGTPSAAEVLANVSAAGKKSIAAGLPYTVDVTIHGVRPILFNRWQDEVVKAGGDGRRGSAEKRLNDPETQVWRDDAGYLCLPGEYVRSMLSNAKGAAKFRQDPRSTRASALDLFRAAIIPISDLCPLTRVTGDKATTWDYIDRRRVVIKGAITRIRPALLEGWEATVTLQCVLPTYISPEYLLEVLVDGGRYVGLGDFRPVFGRFQVVRYQVLEP